VTQRYCTNCGNELDPNDAFCASCGKPTHETAAVPTPEADVDVPTPPTQQQAGPDPNFGPAASTPRQGSVFGKVLIGCTGLLVLAVLFVGCLALVPSGTSSGGGGNRAAPTTRKATSVAVGRVPLPPKTRRDHPRASTRAA